MILNIPLPWLQLVKQKVRFFVALAGIAFISVLMFMQIGFQDALYASATQVHKHLRGDLFLISSQYKSLTSTQSFPRSRLYQILGFNGTESVEPLYVQFAKFLIKYFLTAQPGQNLDQLLNIFKKINL
jgi:putative ABC transport system permease protein